MGPFLGLLAAVVVTELIVVLGHVQSPVNGILIGLVIGFVFVLIGGRWEARN